MLDIFMDGIQIEWRGPIDTKDKRYVVTWQDPTGIVRCHHFSSMCKTKAQKMFCRVLGAIDATKTQRFAVQSHHNGGIDPSKENVIQTLHRQFVHRWMKEQITASAKRGIVLSRAQWHVAQICG